MSVPTNRRFFRDRQNGKIAGVCAGLADYFGVDLTVTRVLAVVALLLSPPLVILLYIGIVIMVPTTDPDRVLRQPERRRFRSHLRAAPTATVTDVKRSLLRLDARLARMERVVTSPRFDLERKIRDL